MLARYLLALKMLPCNETETSATTPIHIQTQSIPKDHDSDMNYNDHKNLSKNIRNNL